MCRLRLLLVLVIALALPGRSGLGFSSNLETGESGFAELVSVGAGTSVGVPDTLGLVMRSSRSIRNGLSVASFRDIDRIEVWLGDNSPDDGLGGAALFSFEVNMISRNGDSEEEVLFEQQDIVRESSHWPVVVGGQVRAGFLSADGYESIVLAYDFGDPAYIGPEPFSILEVEFNYVLANNYRIEIFVYEERIAAVGASDNILDMSNLTVVRVRIAEDGRLIATAVESRSWGYVKAAAPSLRYESFASNPP